MNQLDQLGMRISHIDSAFDHWIKQQNTNYNIPLPFSTP